MMTDAPFAFCKIKKEAAAARLTRSP